MPSAREIRRRIRSVKNIGKVTKAMQTVSASKMRKAQQQVLATRPYADKSWEVLQHLAHLHGESPREHPLLQKRPVQKVGVLLITSDRALAGAYNSNIIRLTARQIYRWQRQENKNVSIVSVGRKGRDWMLRHGPPLRAELTGLDRPTSNDLAPITKVLIDDFIAGVYDAVYIAYTKFHSTIRQEPVVEQLLPIEPRDVETPTPADYIFEPDPQSVLNEILRGITETRILQAVYDSIASEHSARMIAMQNATDSANELMGQLTLRYNKARQEAITRELLDIVGGAAAGKK